MTGTHLYVLLCFLSQLRKGVHVYSHGLLIELVSDPSRHVFEDSDTARHQLQLLILLLHDQLHTHIHAPITSKDRLTSLY